MMHHGGNIYAAAKELGVRPEKLIDFSANINPLGYPAGLRKILRKPHTAILNYPDPNAHDCIAALSRYHRMPRSCFMVGNGSTEFIYLLPDVIRPHRVIMLTPAFTEYRRSYRFRNVHITSFPSLPEDRFIPDIDKLCHMLQNGYDALYLANPGNPTGVLMPKQDVEKIVRNAQRHGTVVVLDEAFIDFNESHSLKKRVQVYKNLFILRSLTKFFGMPGLRIGYLISHPDNIQKVSQYRHPWSVNSIAQCAAIEAVKDAKFIERTRAYVADAKNRLIGDLSAIEELSIFLGTANFLLLRLCSPHYTARDLYQQLLQHGLIIRTCEDFEGLDSSYFRIAVRKKTENRRLVSALKKIVANSRCAAVYKTCS